MDTDKKGLKSQSYNIKWLQFWLSYCFYETRKFFQTNFSLLYILSMTF